MWADSITIISEKLPDSSILSNAQPPEIDEEKGIHPSIAFGFGSDEHKICLLVLFRKDSAPVAAERSSRSAVANEREFRSEEFRMIIIKPLNHPLAYLDSYSHCRISLGVGDHIDRIVYVCVAHLPDFMQKLDCVGTY